MQHCKNKSYVLLITNSAMTADVSKYKINVT